MSAVTEEPQAPDDQTEVTPAEPSDEPLVPMARPQFEVHLDVFDGPFDLLLGLIAKHKLDVTEIALAKVTDDFIAYIDAFGSEWDLEQTTHFLVVAATLLDLKAARLLPQADIDDEDDLALLEARDLLFARLIQYKAYKQVAAEFAGRMAAVSRMYPRSVTLEPRFADLLPEVVLAVGPDEMARMAAEALKPKTPETVGVDHIHYPRVSVREQAAILVEHLRESRQSTFRALTSDCEAPVEVIARFLALLELYREAVVSFDQVTPLGELTVRWTGSDEGEVDVVDDYDERPGTEDEAADVDEAAGDGELGDGESGGEPAVAVVEDAGADDVVTVVDPDHGGAEPGGGPAVVEDYDQRAGAEDEAADVDEAAGDGELGDGESGGEAAVAVVEDYVERPGAEDVVVDVDEMAGDGEPPVAVVEGAGADDAVAVADPDHGGAEPGGGPAVVEDYDQRPGAGDESGGEPAVAVVEDAGVDDVVTAAEPGGGPAVVEDYVERPGAEDVVADVDETVGDGEPPVAVVEGAGADDVVTVADPDHGGAEPDGGPAVIEDYDQRPGAEDESGGDEQNYEPVAIVGDVEQEPAVNTPEEDA